MEIKVYRLKKTVKNFNESVSGNKSSLVNRLYAVIRRNNAGRTEDDSVNSSGDCDILGAKFGKEGATYEDLLRLATGRQWSTDIRTMPDTNFHQLYEYLVMKTQTFGEKVMKGTAYKKERAYAFFEERNLGDIQIAKGKEHIWV